MQAKMDKARFWSMVVTENIQERSIALKSLRHRLDEIPEDIIGHLRMGFELLSDVGAPVRTAMMQAFLAKMADGSVPSLKEGSATSGLPESVVGDAMAAISFAFSLLTDLSVTSDDFVELGTDRLFSVGHTAAAREVAQTALKDKDAIQASADVSKVANAILPSFRNFDYQLDVRVKFSDDNEVIKQVPVLIGYISTDVEEYLCLQFTEASARKLKNKLDEALSRFSVVKNSYLKLS